jgi:capsular exopolysaccharide synthesis family protein
MELRKLLKIAWKWAWLAILAVMIAGTTSYYATQTVTPMYRTTTTLMIGTAIDDPRASEYQMFASQQLAYTYVQLVSRENVLKGTVEALGLQMDWRGLRGQVSATNIPNTQLIDITVIDSDPYRAKVLADEVAQQLILQGPAASNLDNPDQAEFAQQQLDDLKTNIENAQAELVQLNQELDVAISARQIQDLENQINVLNNKISNWQYTYAQLLLSVQGGANRLSLVEAAAIPSFPFSPNVSRNVMVAAVIGLALAVLGVTLIEYLEDTVKTPEEFTGITGLPVLGTISDIDGKNYPEKLVSVKTPFSPVVESYRILRTNLQFAFVDRDFRTLTLTSQGPEEGKSVTLANLAVVFAQTGREVIVVDADLRRPVQHLIFGLNNRVGLTNALLNSLPSDDVRGISMPEKKALSIPDPANPKPSPTLTEDTHPFPSQTTTTKSSTPQTPQTDKSEISHPITDFLQMTAVDHLRFMSSGPLPPNPSELIGSDRMKKVLKLLKAEADIILVDAPPLVVTDATILGSRVDGTIIVLESGRTRAAEIRMAIDELKKGNINLVGAVINRLRRKSDRYYNYRGYYRSDGKAAKGKRRNKTEKEQTLSTPQASGNQKPT